MSVATRRFDAFSPAELDAIHMSLSESADALMARAMLGETGTLSLEDMGDVFETLGSLCVEIDQIRENPHPGFEVIREVAEQMRAGELRVKSIVGGQG